MINFHGRPNFVKGATVGFSSLLSLFVITLPTKCSVKTVFTIVHPLHVRLVENWGEVWFIVYKRKHFTL